MKFNAKFSGLDSVQLLAFIQLVISFGMQRICLLCADSLCCCCSCCDHQSPIISQCSFISFSCANQQQWKTYEIRISNQDFGRKAISQSHYTVIVFRRCGLQKSFNIISTYSFDGVVVALFFLLLLLLLADSTVIHITAGMPIISRFPSNCTTNNFRLIRTLHAPIETSQTRRPKRIYLFRANWSLFFFIGSPLKVV